MTTHVIYLEDFVEVCVLLENSNVCLLSLHERPQPFDLLVKRCELIQVRALEYHTYLSLISVE